MFISGFSAMMMDTVASFDLGVVGDGFDDVQIPTSRTPDGFPIWVFADLGFLTTGAVALTMDTLNVLLRLSTKRSCPGSSHL
jgi:hypothetical protein